MTDVTLAKEKCRGCGREIDICALCQEPECPAAICYKCENRELKQALQHPHPHGSGRSIGNI